MFLQAVPSFPTDGSLATVISWVVTGLVSLLILMGAIVKHIFQLHMTKMQLQITELIAENKQKAIELKTLNDYIHVQIVPIITHNSDCLDRNSALFEQLLKHFSASPISSPRTKKVQ